MFNATSNAAAVSRVNKRIKERHRDTYERMFSTPAGRAFLMELAISCHYYDNVETPEEEGARRIIVALRKEAVSMGLIDKWQLAEKEAADFQSEMKLIIEQTEAKEEDDGFEI